MKLTNVIVSLLSMSLVQISAAPTKRRAQNKSDTIRGVFYVNLCRLTLGLSKFIANNIHNMEKGMPSGSRLNVSPLPFTRRLNLNEKQRLNSYVTQLQSFMPRIKAAISVERNIEGQQFLYNLTLVQYRVMNVKAILRHFIKSLNLPVVKKARGKRVPTNSKSNRLESLGMLKDLKTTTILMNYELNRSRSKFTKFPN